MVSGVAWRKGRAMILALISQKGGVGKSTLARLFAVEMARVGWRVKIADLDPAQGTSTKWKLRRDAGEVAPDVDVQKYRDVPRALKDAAAFDLFILDGPAHAERGGVLMAKAADLVLIPSGFSIDDMEPQVEAAYALESEGVSPDRIRFAFCRAKASEAEERAARDYLRRAGQTPLPFALRELPSIRQAHASGRAASETPHPRVNESAVQVAQEIAKAMKITNPKGN